MKKKFLSLMMAAAVVATTSVSAFADDYSWSDKSYKDVDINITGDITSLTDQVIGGTLSVSVPTTTTFTVAKNGDVTAPQINVENKGTKAIDVYAYKFVDQTPEDNSKITVVGEDELTGASTTEKLSLKLDGDNGFVYLKSLKTGNGLFTDANCDSEADGAGVKLTSVEGNKSKAITLTGKTQPGVSAPQNPTQDKFVLTLKIKKANS